MGVTGGVGGRVNEAIPREMKSNEKHTRMLYGTKRGSEEEHGDD